MNKRTKIMLISLSVVFGGIIAFNVIKHIIVGYFFSHYVPPAVTVSSVVAKSKNWKPHISAVGNFMSINGVDVSSQSGGKVTNIHFTSGQFIEKDSPLIDIDDTVDQATLRYNQADYSLQKTNYQRQLDLLKHNATATSSVDEANAKLLQAEANIQKIQAIINQKHIIAPFSGVLGIRQINLGQYIQPGQTSIVALQSMDPIYLQFYIPEQLIGSLNINQNITFSVEQNPGLVFSGKITAINSRIDSNTHTVEIQASLPNCPSTEIQNIPNSKLIKIKKQKNSDTILVTCDSKINEENHITQFNFVPGMFAAIEVDEPPIPNVVILPSTAISYTMYGDSVFVIEKNKDGHPDKDGQDILTVKRVFITTGDSQGNYTIIKQGISPGQLVVSTGEIKLQDGTRVTINNDVKLPDVKNIAKLGQ